MMRPKLSVGLTSLEFAAWYWLKEELVAFCRSETISPSGSKIELQARISSFLDGGILPKHAAQVRRSGEMPKQFGINTVIGDGWRCSPALGAFFRQTLGTGFRFNAKMRSFIHNGQGKTLAAAVTFYRSSAAREKRPIPPQLEYNRHFRNYFRDNPGASKEDAITAWWAKRDKRKAELESE
jgi:hypothetical protein